jgi:hypothetical protein
MNSESFFQLCLFGLGALMGIGSRWAPLSGWVALALPIVLVPGGIMLSALFC